MIMSERRLNDVYDITIETKMTSENWYQVVDEVSRSAATSLLNVYFGSLFANAWNDGIDLEKEKLGDFLRDKVHLGYTEDLFDYLNEYGELFWKYEEIPLLVIREKGTGRVANPSFNASEMWGAEIMDTYMETVKQQ